MNRLAWHQPEMQRVEQLLAAERLPHALLVRGPIGWGEVHFADWLAHRLLELPVADDVDGELTVPGRTLAHGDMRWVEPEGAVIKVDDIRLLAEFATGTRQSAPRKVAVIEQAHLLNANAANALLKTLEEPPAHTHLILATAAPGRLLPTIVSRCQSLTLSADPLRARQWLCERWQAEDVDNCLFEYGSAPLICEAALRDGETSLLPLLSGLARMAHPTQAVDELLAMDPERLLSRWYRYCIALAAGRINESWAEAISSRRLSGFVDELTRTRRQLLYTNSGNARLLLERLVVNWRSLCTAAL